MLVYFDLETTGLSPGNDCIVQLAATANGSDFSSLVNPGRPIPRHITTLTGISTADVADAPDVKTVVASWCAWLSTLDPPLVLVGHNIARFDIPFLRAAVPELDLAAFGVTHWLDTLQVFRRFRGGAKNSMAALHMQTFGCAAAGAHNALNDVHALRRLTDHASLQPYVAAALLSSLLKPVF